ncbi:MAG: SurA N-terminal domain-containing protein [Pseudomonadota bacterium]
MPGLLLLWSLVVLFGCSGRMDDNTVAVVNGRVIDKAALERAERPWAELSLSDERKLFFRRKAIQQLIDETLILEDAKRSGLMVSDVELEKCLKDFKSDYSGRQFDDMMIREYVNPDEWRERARENLLIGKVTEIRTRERETLQAGEWKAFFQDRLRRETGRIRLKVAHISFSKREHAIEALTRIKAGDDLEAVARDMTARDHAVVIGAPVWIDPSRSGSVLANTLSGLSDGQASTILETKLGYSIFKVVESERNRRIDPRLFLIETRKEFLARQKAQAYAVWIKELRAASRISINQFFLNGDATREMNEKKVDNR